MLNLNYCNTVWGTTNITLIDAVQKLQNFAIRVADIRAKKYDHVTPLFKEPEWLCIKTAIPFNMAMRTYKQVNNFYPQHVVNLTTVTDMPGSRTRQQDQLYVPRTNTQSGGRSFPVTAPVLWNKLQQGVEEAASVQTFAADLNSYLLTHDMM